MAFQPMAVYGLEVPCGDVAIPAKGDIPAAFRITMAAVDPSAESEGPDGAAPRATLKIIRQHLSDYDSEDEDEEDFDPDEMDAMLAGDESSEDDEDDEMNGGPSDPAKSKKARKEAAQAEIKKLLAGHDVELKDEAVNGTNGKSAKAKGKMPASEDEDEDDSDEDEIDEDDVEEFVLCTLDPTKHYQQTLDLTVGEDEAVYFKVSGTHSIFLTGNYIEPLDMHNHGDDMYDSDEDDEENPYGMEEDSDEMDEDMESDELDDMEDPRITEIDEDDEMVPKLIKAEKKGKNKRAAPESEDDATLDNIISKAAKSEEPATNGEAKLSKKQLKKLKKNDGAAAAVEEKKETPGKKVAFAEKLELGPTGSPAVTGKDAKAGAEKPKGALGVKTVQGVTIDDKKLGTGPAAKNGDRVGMRYIGKLQKDNKVFDSNKKGKPFTFKLGGGEVIKGWDIGIAGMSVGAERRITIPANLGYGKQGAGPDIPPNATLVFDVKVMEINKGK